MRSPLCSPLWRVSRDCSGRKWLFCGSYEIMWIPCRLSTAGESSASVIFWQRYLATVLVATHTVANFLGRMTISGKWFTRPAPVRVLAFVVLIRLLFLPCILGYAHGKMHWLLPEDPHNLSIILSYCLMSFSGGLAAMLLSQKAQSLCGHDHRSLALLVGQTQVDRGMFGVLSVLASDPSLKQKTIFPVQGFVISIPLCKLLTTTPT